MDREIANKLLELGMKLKKAREYEDAAAQIYGVVWQEFSILLGNKFNVSFGASDIKATGREIVGSIATGDGPGPDCTLCLTEHGKAVRVRLPK